MFLLAGMKQINVRFSDEELATLQRHADIYERSLAKTVRYLALRKLEETDEESAPKAEPVER